MRTHRTEKEAGFTFAEVAFAMLVLVIGAAVLINHLAVNYRTTAVERDKVFAYAKAQAMLSEIQGFVDRGQVDAAVDLDVLDDGVTSRDALTIATDSMGALVAPDHVLSGNYQRFGRWVWSRRISVQPFTGLNNRNVRYVTVRIYHRDQQGNEHPMADLSSVINSAGAAYPTTQVFDVYLFAIENIPGWWVYMDTIKPFVESMITDLESRNPGLEFRTHWITKAAFGRNQGYRPYVNDAVDSYDPIPDVYHYPGRMPSGSASTFYYVPDNVDGHVNLDGVDKNGYDVDLNPYPYALADFFNHAMRYPDEKALWDARVAAVEAREIAIAAAKAGGTTPPDELDDMSKEPTLRLFLEDLNTDPTKYKNALIINLHGELLPMPALRNFSDAARDPSQIANFGQRVVTHPEELRTIRDSATPSASDPLNFRVYAYYNDPQIYVGDQIMQSPIAIEVVGLDLTDPGGTPGTLSPDCELWNMPGGVLVNGTTDYPLESSGDRGFQIAKHASDPSLVTDEMYYDAEFVDPGGTGERFTRILLYNTPAVCPLDVNGRGLAATDRARLYGLEYVPCPVEAACDFSTNLATLNTALPKNTARWRMSILPNVYVDSSFVDESGTRYLPTDDVVVKVRTRIWTGGSPATSGTVWPPSARNLPEDLSTTYAWWADSADDVPITERSQFNGDPRHCPYKDCFELGDDFPNAYNWYHNDLWDGTNYGGYDYESLELYRLRDRWNGAMSCDVPRYMQMLRTGLTSSKAVYTTLTGYSYYYLGIGNDIGYDSANGYPNSIPSNMIPHGSSGNGYINTITGARRWVRTGGTDWWWGMPWLGEIYPDWAAGTWQTVDVSGSMRGNLDPGTSSGEFYQDRTSQVYSTGRKQSWGVSILDHIQRTSSRGCTAFFNIGSSGSTFDHTGSSGNGTMAAPGLEIGTNYNLVIATTTPVTRPFTLTKNVSGADEWTYSPYSTERFTGSLYKTYFTHSAGTGSGLVKLVDPGNTDAAYIVVNGIANTVDTGTSYIAKWSLLTLVHSFFEAGDTANSLRIQQLPRVELEWPNDISELNDPASIAIQYDIDWSRWDGLPYTQSGTFAENESLLEYVLMYSPDGGDTWLYMQDDSPASPGYRPANTLYVVPDLTLGQETFNWPVPSASFPQGSYLLRIDCFRQGALVHYSYHRTKIFIQR
ncbi:MAG: hypothetical protein KDE27_18845 [Planctomycetes bacterium]|nr:hypothetical protein [Planctomycetota bacterium]